MQVVRAVSQEHPMGCAVACVASLCNIEYAEALQLFQHPENAWTRGFYCEEVVTALSKFGLKCGFEKFELIKHFKTVHQVGTIVFVGMNPKYPMGHFLLRTQHGWMNPWINFPQMIPVESAFEKNLPGQISFLIFQND